jgi:hypothetical protein
VLILTLRHLYVGGNRQNNFQRYNTYNSRMEKTQISVMLWKQQWNVKNENENTIENPNGK